MLSVLLSEGRSWGQSNRSWFEGRAIRSEVIFPKKKLNRKLSALNFIILWHFISRSHFRYQRNHLLLPRWPISYAGNFLSFINKKFFHLSTFIMANPRCNHSFELIKSQTPIMRWNCQLCHWGPHMSIFQCRYCYIKICRICKAKLAGG